VLAILLLMDVLLLSVEVVDTEPTAILMAMHKEQDIMPILMDAVVVDGELGGEVM